MSKKLTVTDAVRENLMVYKVIEQAGSDLAICEAMKRAIKLRSWEEGRALQELTDEQLAEKGWTRDDLVIATDAKAPKAQASFYLHTIADRHLNRERARVNSAGSSAPAAKVVVIPSPTQRSLEEAEPEPEDDEEP